MGRTNYFEQNHFCPWCGVRQKKKEEVCSNCGFDKKSEDPFKGIPAKDPNRIGWSLRIDDPLFANYYKNQRTLAYIFYPIIVLIIITSLLLTDQISLDNEGFYVIGGLTFIFSLFLVGWVIKTIKKGKEWEGLIIKKEQKKRVVNVYNNSSEIHEKKTYYDTILTMRFNNNSERTIVFKDDNKYFDYLKEGDYIKNHQKKNFRYIEKYDKSFDSQIYCAACGYLNDIRNNYCQSCGCPIIK